MRKHFKRKKDFFNTTGVTTRRKIKQRERKKKERKKKERKIFLIRISRSGSDRSKSFTGKSDGKNE